MLLHVLGCHFKFDLGRNSFELISMQPLKNNPKVYNLNYTQCGIYRCTLSRKAVVAFVDEFVSTSL